MIMRVAPYLLSTILFAVAMLGTADAAPATIEGAWSGSGIVKIRNRTDRIVCRVNFDKIAQTSYRVSARCSAGDRSYEQNGRVSRRPIQRQGQCSAFAERLSPDGQRERRPRHGKPDPV